VGLFISLDGARHADGMIGRPIPGRGRVIDDATREEIATLVRSGLYRRADLLAIYCELEDPDALDAAEVGAFVDAQARILATEQATWPAMTDCDRLDVVFAALGQRGVLCLHNAGYTQSDGYDDFRQACDRRADRANLLGYCFYHRQDLERVVRGQGLFLAFGPVDPASEDIAGPAVGRMVQEELARAGFDVTWDGTFAQRIHLPAFVWRRRTSRGAPAESAADPPTPPSFWRRLFG
jgi:hypothetical protein